MAQAQAIPKWREMGRSPDPASGRGEPVNVLVIGAGPVGLTLALDLGRRGHRVTVLGKLDFIPAGSKAICFAKRTLDIFDRLGVGDSIVEKGVVWNVGKIFHGAKQAPVHQFDMLPVKDQKRPAFVNIQQYHVEERLADALAQLPNVEIRWGHEATDLKSREDIVEVEVGNGPSRYTVDAEWVIACDGARSPVRAMLGLDFEGRVFEDNFLIADIEMDEERPAERWFWFNPPFNPGGSALMHKQPDNVWRLDFQLGPDVDREKCIRPERVEPYIRAMLGEAVDFRPVWYSVYTFQCRRMSRFLHGRILFAGDSAHLLSPFGARGCNGGIADADNLGWKLDLILRREAPAGLLESYNDEALVTADENILNSSRSTDFMTPKSAISRSFRDAVLELARDHAFARPFINSGRLSTAVSYPLSSLNTPDEEGDEWPGGVPPGSPALDAPVEDGWLLERIGEEFVLLCDEGAGGCACSVRTLTVSSDDPGTSLLRARYDLEAGSAYLFRPDQYVAARWRHPTNALIELALARAKGT